MKKKNNRTKSRRTFLKETAGICLSVSVLPGIGKQKESTENEGDFIMSVNGKIPASALGYTLSHEHILVDFSGADEYDPARWDHDEVIKTVLPYLHKIQQFGCDTFMECTPMYIGRDPVLLRKISRQTGMHMLTNTGYYGAAENKYLPAHAHSEGAVELAAIWSGEYRYGIGGTGIKPGFIKIGVAPGALSELHRKIVEAAGITHLDTGLTIASHTGPAIPAFEQLDLLQSMGIDPQAFIWVHAQNEEDPLKRVEAAERGAWVSIDGLNPENYTMYAEWLKEFKAKGVLNQILVSQDAGWYTPGEPEGGDFTAYNTVFETLIPHLQKEGFREEDIRQLFVINPGRAFSVKIRRI